MIIAIPWPPPTHMVSRPNVLSWVCRLFSSVAVMRAPVMPNGWPSAIAPPDTFSLSWSMPNSRAEPSTCTANASLISYRSMSSIVMSALVSALRVASMGPRPMTSGDSPDTPVATMRANGVNPSSRALVSLMITTAAAPSFRGHALPAVTVPFGRNTGLSWLTLSYVVPARGPSSFETRTVRQLDRNDLALEEAALDGLLGPVLAAHTPVVLILAADAREQRDVLSRLTHREVKIRQHAVLTRIAPLVGTRCGLHGALLRVGEHRVVRVRPAVGRALREPRNGFHPSGNERAALAGLDRVESHPRGLQRRRAVSVHRRAGQEVVAKLDGHRAADVEAGLTAGLPAAHDQVVDLAGVERRHLVQRRAHHLDGEVVGPHIDQRTLTGAPDRRTSGRNDDGFGHDGSS